MGDIDLHGCWQVAGLRRRLWGKAVPAAAMQQADTAARIWLVGCSQHVMATLARPGSYVNVRKLHMSVCPCCLNVVADTAGAVHPCHSPASDASASRRTNCGACGPPVGGVCQRHLLQPLVVHIDRVHLAAEGALHIAIRLVQQLRRLQPVQLQGLCQVLQRGDIRSI